MQGDGSVVCLREDGGRFRRKMRRAFRGEDGGGGGGAGREFLLLRMGCEGVANRFEIWGCTGGRLGDGAERGGGVHAG